MPGLAIIERQAARLPAADEVSDDAALDKACEKLLVATPISRADFGSQLCDRAGCCIWTVAELAG